jgi:hypothetical protein
MLRFIAPTVFTLAILPVIAESQTVVEPSGHIHRTRASDALDTTERSANDAASTVSMLRHPTSETLAALTAASGQTPSQPRRRDSLWNGVIIGAGLGAIAGAVSGTAIADCSECAGFNVPLTFGVLGAGIGAALGAGIDALHETRGNPLGPTRHVRLSPVLGEEKRGLMAWIRF